MKTTLKISLFALTFAGLFTACKTTQDVATTVESPKDEIVSEVPATNIANETVPDTAARVFFARMVRSPCYGNCPTYEMTIYEDGFVEYKGIRGVDLIGKYTTQLAVSEVQNFRIRANRTGFMEMKDKYDGMISDIPSATTTIVLNGVKKSVYRRYDFPPSILQFEELFDALLKSKKWKAAKDVQE
ncbi:MAG: hypothetical protein HRT57_03720 [Crocinitomicaceae bacterium]|nr:hypothetical protein [Crocinitomicaceae bacterium]